MNYGHETLFTRPRTFAYRELFERDKSGRGCKLTPPLRWRQKWRFVYTSLAVFLNLLRIPRRVNSATRLTDICQTKGTSVFALSAFGSLRNALINFQLSQREIFNLSHSIRNANRCVWTKLPIIYIYIYTYSERYTSISNYIIGILEPRIIRRSSIGLRH